MENFANIRVEFIESIKITLISISGGVVNTLPENLSNFSCTNDDYPSIDIDASHRISTLRLRTLNKMRLQTKLPKMMLSMPLFYGLIQALTV